MTGAVLGNRQTVQSFRGLSELLREATPSLRDPLLLKRTTRIEAPDVLELYHLRYESVDHAGQSQQVIQRVLEIRSAAGAAMPGLDDIWYDGSRWRFDLLQADIWRAGRLVGAGRDKGDARANGNRPRTLEYPQLEIGDRVNLVYALEPLSNGGTAQALLGSRYLGDLFAFRGTYPVERVRYVLRSDHELALSQVGLAGPQQTVEGKWRTWTWESGPLPAFFAEPYGPSITDRSPFVQVSDFANWGELAAWYDAVLSQRALLTPGFREQLLHLVSPRATVGETVQAVWDRLAPRLRYVGDEEGLHAFVPNEVQRVFAARGGDCKDGALLLVTWLRAEGVDADLALVRTRSLGQVATGAATMAAFDHALVYVPALKEYLDTTAPETKLGELPTSDQGALTLIVRAQENELRSIPLSVPGANRVVRRVRLLRRGDGWEANGHVTLRGADAMDARRRDGNPEAARQQLTAWFNQRFPGARLESCTVRDLDASSVHIGFRAWLPDPPRGRREPTVAWSPRQYVAAMASEPARAEARQLPLRWEMEESWTMRAPDRCNSDRSASEASRRQSRFGSFQAEGACRQGWWTVTTRVDQTATTVSAAEYPAYRRFWAAADAFLNGPAEDGWLAMSNGR